MSGNPPSDELREHDRQHMIAAVRRHLISGAHLELGELAEHLTDELITDGYGPTYYG